MDDKILLALIRRMDDMERRVMARIDRIDAFRYKVIGGTMVVSGLISFAIEFLKH